MKMSKSAEKMMPFGKVAVLMGGRSAERNISLMSGNAVLKALRAQGIDAHAFDPAEQDLLKLKNENFDRCFVALHGRYGEDGTIQGVLELLGVPYTGSGVMASSIAMNKIMTKNIWQAKGLPTPSWHEVESVAETLNAFKIFNETMIVKPAFEGSSIGITKVTSIEQCEAAYTLAAKQDAKVICEQFISGDEVTCTILNISESTQALPVIKIIAPDGKYDYQNKYFTNDTKYIIPCGLPNGEENKIQTLAIKAFNAVCGRGWARLDIMIDGATRQPYLLEINTAPGMTGHSLSPMSALHQGYSFENLCLKILATASLDYKNI